MGGVTRADTRDALSSGRPLPSGLKKAHRLLYHLTRKAHRLLYHSTLGLRVIKKKRGVTLADTREALSSGRPLPFERSHRTVTSKVSTGASTSLYQARLRTVAVFQKWFGGRHPCGHAACTLERRALALGLEAFHHPCGEPRPADRYSSQFKNNYFTEMCSSSKAGSNLRPIHLCITQLKA